MKTLAALLLILGIAGPAFAGTEWDRQIRREFRAAGLPEEMAVLVAHAESSGRPWVPGRGGERGLFQLDRATWERCSRRPWSQAYDARANIEAAVNYWLERKKRSPAPTSPTAYAAWHNAGRLRWWRLHPKWTIRHENRIYRRIYTEAKERRR